MDTRENIFVATEQQVHYRRPQPLQRDRAQRDPAKFCRFHNDVGHHTNKCRLLKDEIENLIKLGHLHQYSRGVRPQNLQGPNPAGPAELPANPPQGPPPVNGRVNTITGGPHLGGTSRVTQNRYVRALNHDGEVMALEQLQSQTPQMTD